MAYRFIEENYIEFRVRWLLRRLHIYPNAYYNYLKHRKASYYEKRDENLQIIEDIYHEHGGVAGYRQVQAYLTRRGIALSGLTVHVYMNQILGLHSRA